MLHSRAFFSFVFFPPVLLSSSSRSSRVRAPAQFHLHTKRAFMGGLLSTRRSPPVITRCCARARAKCIQPDRAQRSSKTKQKKIADRRQRKNARAAFTRLSSLTLEVVNSARGRRGYRCARMCIPAHSAQLYMCAMRAL